MRYSSNGEMWSNRKILVSFYFFHLKHIITACSIKCGYSYIILWLPSHCCFPPFPKASFSVMVHGMDIFKIQFESKNNNSMNIFVLSEYPSHCYFSTFEKWSLLCTNNNQRIETRIAVRFARARSYRMKRGSEIEFQTKPSRRLHEVLQS